MKKLRSNKGFTLIEMVACVVTLLLVGLICSTGMNLAMNSYRESVFESDSQMLESTINMYVGDILRHATDIKTTGASHESLPPEYEVVDEFTNEAYGVDMGSIEIEEKIDQTGQGYLVCTKKYGEETINTKIVSDGTYAGTLYIKDFVIGYDAEKGIFKGSYTIVSTVTETTKTCSFTYRTIVQ